MPSDTFVTVPAVRTPVEREAPPSTYAVAALLNKEPGAAMRVLGVTAVRTVTIVPGVWLASKTFVRSVNFWQVILISVFTSTTITLGMLGWYWLKKRAATEEIQMRAAVERAAQRAGVAP
jgi:hypothetical protein